MGGGIYSLYYISAALSDIILHNGGSVHGFCYLSAAFSNKIVHNFLSEINTSGIKLWMIPEGWDIYNAQNMKV